MGLREHAEKELHKAGFFERGSDYEGKLGVAVMQLVDTFAAQGHSGFSASVVIRLFSSVAAYKLLSPIENPMQTREYRDVSEYSGERPGTVLQSTLLSSLFSSDGGKRWYDLDKKKSRVARLFTGNRAYVRFPYSPEV